MNTSEFYSPLSLAMLDFKNLVSLQTMSLTVDSSKGLLDWGFGKPENGPIFFAVPVVLQLNPIQN